MSSVIFFAFLFVVIPLCAYYLFGYIVIFHIRRYGLDKPFCKQVVLVFCLGLIATSCMIVQKFTAINWKNVSLSEIVGDTDINFFYGNYDRR